MTVSQETLELRQHQHPIVNEWYRDAIYHRMGLTAYAGKLRAFAAMGVDHVHNGSRYWQTSEGAQSMISAAISLLCIVAALVACASLANDLWHVLPDFLSSIERD